MSQPKPGFNPAKSLALWKARLAWRERRLAAAHKSRDKDRVAHWTKLVKEAQRTVDKRTAQVAKARPLRLRAWDEMQKLIDEKVTEVGGNNRGVRVEQIIRANGGTPGEPWCGDTVAYCYLRAGAKSVVRAWASVSWLNRLLASTSHPSRGCVVTYSFDHTGMFDRWDPAKGPGWFLAGEGNTGNAGAVSDSQTGGDGVKLKSRHTSQVAAFRTVSK